MKLFRQLATSVVLLIALAVPVCAGSPDAPTSGLSVGQLLGAALAWLLPIGVALIGLAALPTDRAVPTAGRAVALSGIAILAYWLVGFAFQFGGVGLATPSPGLAGLTREWSLFDVSLGPGWGMVGLSGFMPGRITTPPLTLGLLLWHTPWLASASVLLALAWGEGVRNWVRPLGALVLGAVLYPLFGNWLLGGGWLAGLGNTLHLGHGVVDLGGSLLFLVPGLLGLAGIFLARRVPSEDGPAELPPVHLPLLALTGLVLMGVGLSAALLGNPLLPASGVSFERVGLNLIIGAIAASLGASAYGWLASGRSELLLAARAGAAGLVAMAACAPFVALWAAAVIGVTVGALFPFFLYLFERVAGLDDRAGTIPTFVVGAIWGLLALAIFADGGAGAGWNGVGLERFLGLSGLGVTGLFAEPGFLAGWQGQLYAQLVGIGAAIVWALVLPWGTGRIAQLVLTVTRPKRTLFEEELGSIERKPLPPLR